MTSVAEHLASIESALALAEKDNDDLIKGRKSAAAKVRNHLLTIGKLVSEARKDVFSIGKGIIVRKRVPKEEIKDASSDESPDPVPEDSPIAAPLKKLRARAKPKVTTVAPLSLEAAKE